MNISELDNMGDSDLAEAAAGGSRNALSALFLRWRRYVYAVAWKICMNNEDALDVTQNVFAKLPQKLGGFQQRGAFRSWLGAVAARESMDLMRRIGRRREVSDSGVAVDYAPDDSPTAPELLDLKQKRKIVEDAMRILSPQQRAVLTLRLKEGMKTSAISESLDIPAKQVSCQLCRAVAKLQSIIAEMNAKERS